MQTTYDQQPASLIGQSFNLGSIGGGSQVIIFDQAINPSQHHVITVGDAPQLNQASIQPTIDAPEPKNIGRQLFESIRNHLPKIGKNASINEPEMEDNRSVLRCFRLTFQEAGKLLDGKFLTEEFVDPQMIVNFVRQFLSQQQTPEMTM